MWLIINKQNSFISQYGSKNMPQNQLQTMGMFFPNDAETCSIKKR